MAVGRPRGKGFNYVVAIGMVALFIAAAKTADDFRSEWVKDAAHADARTEAYFAAHPRRFCAFEGVWYDWDDDETITLGCIEVKGNIRKGSYSSATGPRATSNFSMSGTYDIDSDSSMQVIGKDWERKDVKFTTLIYVEDPEYPTQMIVIDEKGEGGFYIWQRKE
jgi:carotenoid cleavage dioxygenase-like enzyme